MERLFRELPLNTNLSENACELTTPAISIGIPSFDVLVKGCVLRVSIRVDDGEADARFVLIG